MKKPTATNLQIITSKQKPREAFERVRAKRERNEIMRKIIEKNVDIMLKGNQEVLFVFRASGLILDKGIIGQILEHGEIVAGDETLIGNFSLASDKYFFQTTAQKMKDGQFFLTFEELYLLQRRVHARHDLEPGIERSVAIVQRENKVLYCKGEALDISFGGSKLLLLPTTETFASGDSLKVSFHINERWNFEATGSIRFHASLEDGTQKFGFQFDENSKKALSGKLQMMIVDLQRRSFKSAQKA